MRTSVAGDEDRAGSGTGRPQAGVLALRAACGHLIRRAQQRHTLLWTAEFGGDLTGPQYAVVSAIAGGEGLDQRAVGERASLDKSSTADVVARLQAQGWLRQARDPADMRRKTLTLTPLARAALGDVTRRAGRVQRRLLHPLPDGGVEGFVAALRQVAYAGAPPVARQPTADVLVLRDTPGHLIRRAQQVHTAAWAAEVGRAVTAPQYAVLSVLWDHPDGIDQSGAAALASLDRSSMADVVQRLVTRGWVARTRDAQDARRRLLTLTDPVRADLDRLTPAVRRVQDRLLEPLAHDEERATFLDGLRALAYSDDGVDGDSAPDEAAPSEV